MVGPFLGSPLETSYPFDCHRLSFRTDQFFLWYAFDMNVSSCGFASAPSFVDSTPAFTFAFGTISASLLYQPIAADLPLLSGRQNWVLNVVPWEFWLIPVIPLSCLYKWFCLTPIYPGKPKMKPNIIQINLNHKPYVSLGEDDSTL